MRTGKISLYAILGVAEDADPVVIESVYRALISKYHPDRSAGDGGKAAEINFAYSTLRNPQKRREYDEQLRLEREWRSATFSPGPPPRARVRRVPPAVWIGPGAALAVALALLVFRQPQSPPKVSTDLSEIAAKAPDYPAFEAEDQAVALAAADLETMSEDTPSAAPEGPAPTPPAETGLSLLAPEVPSRRPLSPSSSQCAARHNRSSDPPARRERWRSGSGGKRPGRQLRPVVACERVAARCSN